MYILSPLKPAQPKLKLRLKKPVSNFPMKISTVLRKLWTKTMFTQTIAIAAKKKSPEPDGSKKTQDNVLRFFFFKK